MKETLGVACKPHLCWSVNLMVFVLEETWNRRRECSRPLLQEINTSRKKPAWTWHLTESDQGWLLSVALSSWAFQHFGLNLLFPVKKCFVPACTESQSLQHPQLRISQKSLQNSLNFVTENWCKVPPRKTLLYCWSGQWRPSRAVLQRKHTVFVCRAKRSDTMAYKQRWRLENEKESYKNFFKNMEALSSRSPRHRQVWPHRPG